MAPNHTETADTKVFLDFLVSEDAVWIIKGWNCLCFSPHNEFSRLLTSSAETAKNPENRHLKSQLQFILLSTWNSCIAAGRDVIDVFLISRYNCAFQLNKYSHLSWITGRITYEFRGPVAGLPYILIMWKDL